MVEENEKQEAAPKKKSPILFVVIGLVVVLLIVVAAVFFMMSGSEEEKIQNAPAVQNAQPVTKVVVGNSVSARQSDYMKIGPIYVMETPFVINLVTQTGRRYLKTSVNLELDKIETEAELKVKAPIITDIIIEVASSKSIEEISTAKGKNRLKDELVQRINEVLIDGFVKNIFFTEFVIN